ncbi:unnamed protein product [Linum tenue]|uniref:Pectinesterase n=1 Tax=Linum tenue TaxID=586396 RepID=A0AAV0S4S2_9ROSI|nr:unnamed protein product [Linum tenue]
MDTITTTKFLLLITLIIVNVSFMHGGAPTVTESPDLRRLSIMDAMNHATEAHRQLLTISSSSSSNFVHNSLDDRQHDLRAEATSAWYDCAELYEEALGHLNRSLGSTTTTTTTNPSSSDTLTWLSAALANRQTCRDGFLDLNLTTTTTSLPRVMDDFSRSLRNALAINAAAGGGGGGRKLLSAAAAAGGGARSSSTPPPVFPWWVAKSDRQLLEARPSGAADVGPKAHLVVAQDGSGDYSTISEAVAASVEMRRGRAARGRRRFVIYVKRGIYKESVEIKKSMNNIMVVGDGIDATIISNCKNVRDGFTTYRSATFGCVGAWVHSEGHDVREHGGANEAPGGGAPLQLRPLRVLSVQLQGLPRHPLPPLHAPVLPRLRHLRHRRLHLRGRRRRPPGMQRIRQEATAETEGHRHRTGPLGSQREHGHRHPSLQGDGFC